MKFPPYASYKDSGIDWLGQIPEHWELWKVAHAFSSIGSGTTPPSDEQKWYGGKVAWVTTSELRERLITETIKTITSEALKKFSALKLHPKGSILIAMYGATIGRVAILGIEATTNQACCVLSESRVLYSRFVYYWLIGFRNEIVSLAYGAEQPNISQDLIVLSHNSCPRKIKLLPTRLLSLLFETLLFFKIESKLLPDWLITLFLGSP